MTHGFYRYGKNYGKKKTVTVKITVKKNRNGKKITVTVKITVKK